MARTPIGYQPVASFMISSAQGDGHDAPSAAQPKTAEEDLRYPHVLEVATMHTCESLVLSCMDWRLRPALYDKIAVFAGTTFDAVTVPGGVKALLESGPVRDFLLGAVAISASLHKVRRAVLVNHTDCGAYGGRCAFKSDEEEMARHRDDLLAAARVVGERFFGLEVITLLAALHERDGTWEVSFLRVGL